MPKVKMLVPISGASGSYNIGDTYECTPDEAVRFVEAGMATPLREAEPKETATRKTPTKEKAVK
jgi:hypothetical protein